jgi:hypothetical protein
MMNIDAIKNETEAPRRDMKHPKPTKRYDMQGVFDGFTKLHAIVAHKSSTSPNIESRCSSVTIEPDAAATNDENDDVIDVQSIQIAHDIYELASVTVEDTRNFVPNVQYGKVLHVCSGSEFIIAARIYNGYTKVLRPQLYRFRIQLHGVSADEPMFRDILRDELSTMILNKIVLLYHLTFQPSESPVHGFNHHIFHTVCCLGANVHVKNLHINDIMNTSIRQHASCGNH